jgi:hypothetical protein
VCARFIIVPSRADPSLLTVAVASFVVVVVVLLLLLSVLLSFVVSLQRYTWYVSYTESRAKHEIGNWTELKLPLDVWGLDMNWRNVGAGKGASPGDPESIKICRLQNATGALPDCRSHFYNHPNTDLLPGLNKSSDGTNEWFDYIKSKKLRTYFNDHPYPLADQTTPEEVAFRYQGTARAFGRRLHARVPLSPTPCSA